MLILLNFFAVSKLNSLKESLAVFLCFPNGSRHFLYNWGYLTRTAFS